MFTRQIRQCGSLTISGYRQGKFQSQGNRCMFAQEAFLTTHGEEVLLKSSPTRSQWRRPRVDGPGLDGIRRLRITFPALAIS